MSKFDFACMEFLSRFLRGKLFCKLYLAPIDSKRKFGHVASNVQSVSVLIYKCTETSSSVIAIDRKLALNRKTLYVSYFIVVVTSIVTYLKSRNAR